MNKAKNFNMRASDEFLNILEKLSVRLDKPKTRIVEMAAAIRRFW